MELLGINTHTVRDAVVSSIGERGARAVVWIILALLSAFTAWILVTHLDLTVIGLLIGGVYALGAVGLSLVYGNMHFPNIAHGDTMTAAAFVALTVMVTWLPETWSMNSVGMFTFPYTLFIALPIGMAVVALGAVLVDRFVYRRLRLKAAQLGVITLASLGVAIALRGLIQYIWGTEIQNYPRESKKFLRWDEEFLDATVFTSYPPGIHGVRLDIGFLDTTVLVPPDMIFVFAAAVVLTLALYLFLNLTRAGKAMRAAADNEDLAAISGINVERSHMLTWAIAGATAGAAGILFAAGQGQLLTISGWKLMIPMFAAVVAGGIGNPYGAFAGAIMIGVIGEVSTEWLDPTYKPAVFFAAIIVMLLVRPRGLFGASRV